jgi:TRAP-type mannitol/chloroaromatic compound transport system permease large subunit
MGAVGAVLIAAGARRLNLKMLRAVALETSKITAMMMLILMMAQVFALAFRGLHGEDLITDLFELLPGGVNSDIWFMMALIFVLGFFIEWIEISYIAVPLFMPVLLSQGVDPVWLAMLITVNLQSSFLTPPFGWALFYLKGVAPPEVTIKDIYKGVVPFLVLQGVTLALVFFYPQIALWLPRAIGW